MKRFLRGSFVVLSLLVFALFLKASIPQVPTGTWKTGANLNTARSSASAVLLPDGRILIVGGTDANGTVLASAEFVNTDGSVSAAPSMSVARTSAAAIVLPDGDVLVAGGTTSDGGFTNSAELYNPTVNSWQTLSATMASARSGHTMSQLLNGDVLIAGGDSSNGPVAAIEVFDEVTNAFAQVGTLVTGRKDHAASVLQDGRMFIAGGTDVSGNTLASTEIYDPKSSSVTAGPPLNTARAHHSATTLLDGTVFIAGGSAPAADPSAGSVDLASAEIYDPVANTINASSASLTTARSGHLAFLLSNNNNVLIVGGNSAGVAQASVEMYTPWTKQFSATRATVSARAGASGAPFRVEGLLLVMGGQDANSNTLASTEWYRFATVNTDKSDYLPGEMVTITGTGWQPGEIVTLTIIESPNVDSPAPFTVTANADGTIFNQQFVPDTNDLGTRFFLTAVGSQSGFQAQNTFADATSLTLTPSSGPVGTSVTVTSGGNAFDNRGTTVGIYWDGELRTATGTNVATCAANNNISAGCTFAVPASAAVGTHTVVATQIGKLANSISATFTVTNLPTTLTTVNAASGTYGGETSLSATLTSGGTGVNGKTISFTLNDNVVGTATTNASGVATLSNVSLSGITANTYTNGVGASFAGDSSYTASSGSASLTVSPAPLTATVTIADHQYDGTTNASISGCTLSGVVGTDNVTCDTSGATAQFASADAGNAVTVNVSGLALTGTKVNDYSLLSTATASGKITPKPLTATVTIADHQYDGTTNASISGCTLSGVVGTDNVTCDTSGATAQFASADAGNAVTVNVSGLALTGTKVNDYSLPSTATASGKITPKPLTATVTIADHQYDGTTNASISGCTLSGVVGTDNVTCDTSGATAQFASADAGNAVTVNVSGLALTGTKVNDYSLPSTATASGKITPKPLTATVTIADHQYDGTTNASISGCTLSGVVGTDNVTCDTSGATAQFASADAGNAVTVNVSGLALTGTKVNDYSLSSTATASGKITPKPLTATVTADPKQYDGTTAVTLHCSLLSGVISPDEVTCSATGAFDTKNVATPQTVTIINIALAGTKAGDYTLTATTGTTTANITPAPLKIAANNESKTYGQSYSFVGTEFTPTGLFAGDTVTSVTLTSTGAPATATVAGSPYAIVPSNALGTGLGNYTITYNNGSLTVTQATTTTVLTSSANPSSLNQAVMFTATVNPQYTGVPTGSVQFYDGATLLGTSSLNTSGVATLQTATLAVNAHSITANYGGDTNFKTSGSTVLTQTVQYLTGGMCYGDYGHQVLQPINSDGSSIAKQGSTVPVKFRVCDANGVSIGTPGVVMKFTLDGVLNGTVLNTVTEDIVSTTPDSAFRWDATNQQWIFNLSTKNLAKGATYVYTIWLNDGTIIGPAVGGYNVGGHSFQFGTK